MAEQQQCYSRHAFVDAADANVPAMEQSWIVHTVVLPACMISPLWWRFLQNMRQVNDSQQRWPYLGNALKYFCAASVAMTGVYHPRLVNQSSPVWLTCFVVATLYQVSTEKLCACFSCGWFLLLQTIAHTHHIHIFVHFSLFARLLKSRAPQIWWDLIMDWGLFVRHQTNGYQWVIAAAVCTHASPYTGP